MKYLFILGLVLLGMWFWRNNRRTDINQSSKKSAKNQPEPLGTATEIVACDVCHLHLPRSEALTGPVGVYCCDAHRQQASG